MNQTDVEREVKILRAMYCGAITLRDICSRSVLEGPIVQSYVRRLSDKKFAMVEAGENNSIIVHLTGEGRRFLVQGNHLTSVDVPMLADDPVDTVRVDGRKAPKRRYTKRHDSWPSERRPAALKMITPEKAITLVKDTSEITDAHRGAVEKIVESVRETHAVVCEPKPGIDLALLNDSILIRKFWQSRNEETGFAESVIVPMHLIDKLCLELQYLKAQHEAGA